MWIKYIICNHKGFVFKSWITVRKPSWCKTFKMQQNDETCSFTRWPSRLWRLPKLSSAWSLHGASPGYCLGEEFILKRQIAPCEACVLYLINIVRHLSPVAEQSHRSVQTGGQRRKGRVGGPAQEYTCRLLSNLFHPKASESLWGCHLQLPLTHCWSQPCYPGCVF